MTKPVAPFTPQELDAFCSALFACAASGRATQPPHPSWLKGYTAHMARTLRNTRAPRKKQPQETQETR